MKLTKKFLVLAMVLGASTAHAELLAHISAAGSSSKFEQSAGDAVIVTLTNTGKKPLYVLKWNTPVGELTEDLFHVSLNGQDVPYTGKLVKRTFPEFSDYVMIDAGQSLSGRVELSGAYDMYRAGTYSVQFHGTFQDAIELSDQAEVKDVFEVESGNTTVKLASASGISAFDLYQAPSERAVSYYSCSSSRQTSLATAHNSAKTYSANSLNYFTGKTASTVTTRYRTWFGTATTSRFNSVKSHYSLINTALNTKSVVYDCSCTDSYYAYVYPTSPYRIYLCNAFWSAPNTGTDSRAGTIIHEMSHFNVNGGTDDHVYGQSGAKSLATSNPTKAVDNADNHEYFSENTPAQN